ncbi:helix-turn-helix transcriptional regulator [Pandoraea apista]|uniref:HTH cro/C1-type domain-containing protein n=1 Tax=Pandoraea apista TaxID=93218 RepID=A0A5E5PBX9_9BURK|nr:helix-turn-helix transcriptional regulator [Pandoraea apista]OXS92655.1 hypothetical protein B7H01_17105 [Pandoraea apista]PTE00851.1 hypothetical protein C7830_11480 [Pandoraea apista]RRJ30814.1 hypothetical protein EIB05_13615 [Pandoraea apista]RRJ74559.1 hypothetical protein EIL82_14990 [Pandoraea apista]RSD06406.1 hypothetical protein EJB12_21985 [Pandoraea apista]
MALGKNVQHLRLLRGESRPELARQIGIESQQPIYALERRDSTHSELAPSLAKHFGVDLDTLLTEDLTQIDLDGYKRLCQQNAPDLSQGDRQFIEDVTNAIAERELPDSVRESIRLLISSSPKKTNK